MENKKYTILLFAGASGTGKTTLVDQMVDDLIVDKAITCTTRKKRKGEIDGVHYHFISKEKMFEMYEGGDLVEPPNEHAGNYYACPISSLKSDRPVALIVDINGIKRINEALKREDDIEVKNICIDAPEKSVLLKRWVDQGRSGEEIDSRLKVYENEKKWASSYDFDKVLKIDKTLAREEQISSFIGEVMSFIPSKKNKVESKVTNGIKRSK